MKSKKATRCNNRDNCFTLFHFENFNIFEGLHITQLNIYDGAFIAKIVSRYEYSSKSSIVDIRLVSNTPLLFEDSSNVLFL